VGRPASGVAMGGEERLNFQEWLLKLKKQTTQSFGDPACLSTPLISNVRE
jgi:hypothetical protein